MLLSWIKSRLVDGTTYNTHACRHTWNTRCRGKNSAEKNEIPEAWQEGGRKKKRKESLAFWSSTSNAKGALHAEYIHAFSLLLLNSCSDRPTYSLTHSVRLMLFPLVFLPSSRRDKIFLKAPTQSLLAVRQTLFRYHFVQYSHSYSYFEKQDQHMYQMTSTFVELFILPGGNRKKDRITSLPKKDSVSTNLFLCWYRSLSSQGCRYEAFASGLTDQIPKI